MLFIVGMNHHLFTTLLLRGFVISFFLLLWTVYMFYVVGVHVFLLGVLGSKVIRHMNV